MVLSLLLHAFEVFHNKTTTIKNFPEKMTKKKNGEEKTGSTE